VNLHLFDGPISLWTNHAASKYNGKFDTIFIKTSPYIKKRKCKTFLNIKQHQNYIEVNTASGSSEIGTEIKTAKVPSFQDFSEKKKVLAILYYLLTCNLSKCLHEVIWTNLQRSDKPAVHPIIQ